MSKPGVRVGAASLAAALLLSIVIATPSLAAGWTWRVIHGADDFGGGTIGFPGGLVVLPPTTAVVLTSEYSYYGDNINYGAYIRRSTDSGLTWQAPITLSNRTTGGLAIAGRGAAVDAAWVDKRGNPDAAEVRYARSSNAGASFASSVVIASPQTGFPKDVSAARGPHNTVAIAWTTQFAQYSTIRVRVSHDGGLTFGSPMTLASGSLREVKLAVGDGIIYAAYIRTQNRTRSLEMRYSPNNGSAWTQPALLATDLFKSWYVDVDTAPAVTAEGDQAYVGYVSNAREFWYRRTADRGLTWSLATRLSGPLKTARVAMNLTDGIVHVAYDQCAVSACWLDRLRYRSTADGIIWTQPQDVDGSDIGLIVAGVGRAARPIVVYMLPPDGSGCCAFGTWAAIKN